MWIAEHAPFALGLPGQGWRWLALAVAAGGLGFRVLGRFLEGLGFGVWGFGFRV